MEGILIESGDTLRLTGYNLETGIQATVPARNHGETGIFYLKEGAGMNRAALIVADSKQGLGYHGARLFGEIVRKMPDDMVVFSSQGYTVNIKCGLSEFNIMGTDPEEFPELPAVDQQKNALHSRDGALSGNSPGGDGHGAGEQGFFAGEIKTDAEKAEIIKDITTNINERYE